ncbi:MAG: 16S rRNA (guanine(527)-N(7))-methyltransferase RsmG, partial [Proteobacteria bacterium]|nr:16S rRNA (guanine(527)-N(7))-methyltransferase RsmG [Pseudomonadota bacterium]
MGSVPGSPAVQLAQGARQIGLELSQASCARLLDYVALLRRWNRVHNLTTIDDASKMLTHHLLDSLSIAPFVS